MNKITHLQWLRAMAALIVVWTHALSISIGQGVRSWQSGFFHLPEIGAVGVDIFFVISGFIVSISAGRASSPSDFLLRRFIRIWPIYAIATIAIFLIAPEGTPTAADVIRSMLFLQEPGNVFSMPVHPYGWSLMFEAMFYAVLALAISWNGKLSLIWRMYGILSIPMILGPFLGYQQPLNIIGNPIAIEFALGVFIGHKWRCGSTWSLPAATAVLVGGLALLCAGLVFGVGRMNLAQTTLSAALSLYRAFIWGVPAALVVAAFVFWPIGQARNRPMEFLGDASYSIYLFSLIALRLIERHWPAIGNHYPDAMVAAMVLIAVGVGVAAYLLIERPLLKWINAFIFTPSGRIQTPNPEGAAH